jgi:hypothetical protein
VTHVSKLNRKSHDQISRGLCHSISIAITAVLAVFAAEGAAALWPTHPVVAQLLAVLCAMAAGIGHIRFCAQFSVKNPTQSRLLLGGVIVIFGAVSVFLGSIAEYRTSVEPPSQIQRSPMVEVHAADHAMSGRSNVATVARDDQGKMEPAALVQSFVTDLRKGSANAQVPFWIGCFLELLPIATLLLTVPRTSK